MNRWFRGRWLSLGLALGWGITSVLRAQTPELRGWWVDTWHPALRTPAEVDALVAHARAARFNALFVEVRKRGDAYYNSRFEPRASEVQAGFDPLAYLILRARAPGADPPLEVHAWIVTYIIWNQQTTLPPQTNHPYRLHPDWLTESFTGEQWDGSHYAFDPGHPAVQQHTFNVALDLLSRYDLDGLHFDYIRYAGRDWGYNPVALARFNTTTASTGRPAPDDSAWQQWRRDQITTLLRRVYLAAAAVRPHAKISAATITWTPAATSFPTWLQSAAWSHVLQDWRGWMAEGLLDLNIPMAYFRQETHAAAWSDWSRFAKQTRFQRHVALGVGAYLNTISNSIVQMRSTRLSQGATAPRADGLLVFSYAVPARDGVPRSEFITALTTPTGHDPVTPPLFAEPVAPPAMPWKTDGSVTGLSGTVRNAEGQPLEGAVIELCGEAPELLITDANGAFARLLPHSPPAAFLVSAPGYLTQIHPWPEDERRVLYTHLVLAPDHSPLQPRDLKVSVGRDSAVVTWRTDVPTLGRVRLGPGAACESGAVASEAAPRTRHALLLGGLDQWPWVAAPELWLRVVNEAADHPAHLSGPVLLQPASRPLLAGEWEVRRTGTWSFVQTGSGHPPAGYWTTPTTTGSPSATARWRVTAAVPGWYDIEYRLPAHVGAAGATYEVRTRRLTRLVRLNQSQTDSGFRKLATQLWLDRDEMPEVVLANPTGTAGQTLAVGAVRWVYRDGQDPPPAPGLPAWWVAHFFAEAPDPWADADGDGFSNLAEFVFGTDPTDAGSHLRLGLAPGTDGAWWLTLSPAVAGRRYAVEQTHDVVSGPWQEVQAPPEPQPLAEGLWGVPLPAQNAAARFFRLKAAVP